MKSIFHKNLIHPGVFTHPLQNKTQQECDSAEAQYTKSIEDEISIVPITSELQYFERKVHLYKGYPSSLEPLADLHSIIVRSLHLRNDNSRSNNNHLNLIKYEVRTTTGKLLFFIKEQTDSFTRGVKCCAKPEPKVLNIMTCGDNSGIQLYLEYGLAGICKKITTILNSRQLGTVEVNSLSLYPLSYRSFRAFSSHNHDSQRQEKFTVVQKGNRLVDLCGCGFPSATSTSSSSTERTNYKKEFQVSFGTKGFSKGKIRKDSQRFAVFP